MVTRVSWIPSLDNTSVLFFAEFRYSFKKNSHYLAKQYEVVVLLCLLLPPRLLERLLQCDQLNQADQAS